MNTENVLVLAQEKIYEFLEYHNIKEPTFDVREVRDLAKQIISLTPSEQGQDGWISVGRFKDEQTAYCVLAGELMGTLRGIIDFYNPDENVKKKCQERIAELKQIVKSKCK